MSNRRIIWMLLFAILFLSLAHVFLSMQGVGNTLVSRTTLMDVAAQSADRIVLRRAGEAPLVLKNLEEWRIVEPYAARADERAVRRLVDALTLSRIRNVYTDQDLLKFGRTRGDYGLESPLIGVELEQKGKVHSVGFGSQTPTGDGIFAQAKADSANVYVVETNVLSAVGLPFEAYRLRSLCSEGMDTVDAFDLKRGSGSFMRFKSSGNAWVRLGAKDEDPSEPASTRKIRRLIADLSSARAESFVWPVGATNEPQLATASLLAGYGLDPESAVTVTFRGVGMSDQQISFGKPATDGRVYALVQNAGAIVTVDGALSDFVRTTDFADLRLFPYEADQISRISITEAGVNYLLAKGKDGAWLLDAPVAAPADSARVNELLSRLMALSAADRDVAGLVVSLQTNAPVETISQRALLDGFSLADLRSRDVLRIESSDVRRVTISAGTNKLVAVLYDGDLRKWKVDSPETTGTVSESAIAGLLKSIEPLHAEKIVKLKLTTEDLQRYGLDKPRHTVAIDFSKEGSLRRNILIGEKSRGGHFATLGASDAVFILSDAVVKALTSPLVEE